jgi:hypothetical protein
MPTGTLQDLGIVHIRQDKGDLSLQHSGTNRIHDRLHIGAGT